MANLKHFHFIATILLVVSAASLAAAQTRRPVVLMHGVTSSYKSMVELEGFIKQDYPGIYVHNARIGDGDIDSVIIDMNKQVEMLAQQVKADPNLANGFDLIGHSQGGLLTRGYIQRFNDPPVHNYISLAGPHNGVFGVPDLNKLCPVDSCPWLADLMSKLAYDGWAEKLTQELVSFAQYWRDPTKYDLYLNASTFLADLNNERPGPNAALYVKNLASVNKMFFLKDTEDDIVLPNISEFFGYFDIGSMNATHGFQQDMQYTKNLLGLRDVYAKGALKFATVVCTHSAMPHQECKSTVYEPWIKPNIGGYLP